MPEIEKVLVIDSRESITSVIKEELNFSEINALYYKQLSDMDFNNNLSKSIVMIHEHEFEHLTEKLTYNIPRSIILLRNNLEDIYVSEELDSRCSVIKPLNFIALKRAVQIINYQANFYDIKSTLQHARFRYKTIEEAEKLASVIAKLFPVPERVFFGIHEMLINAVEHGNLNIGYQEKLNLMKDRKLFEEINLRIKHKEFAEKSVNAIFRRVKDCYELLIIDQGKGFDYREFLTKEIPVNQLTGKGIKLSRMMSFDELIYLGRGNRVLCRVYSK